MAETWKVFRCSACGMCHGRKSVGHNCPHCGQRINESTPVVDKAVSSTELRMKVLMANTPPELRESLAKKLSDSDTLIQSNKAFSAALGLRELRKLVDDRGNVGIEAVTQRFSELGFHEEVSEFLDSAEAQGVIVRLGDGIWHFLE